ncbi:sperm acrosome membrane-associated protein 6 isoform X3 [Phocoena sinus]|uniref:sperm acrosome membrane-associated protein 6 isoform X3 n=1 Tax=Phocoena sinus TaxID=42100 RepID=UPI0013C42430|nr:sperm acrosome membrane-associated protein 6 isoform X3 [Phocoena sinus]
METLRGPETQRQEDRGFAGARDSETGGQRLCWGQRREDRDFAGARDSDRRTKALRGPETQRQEDRGFAGARDSETGGQRLCGGQRLRDRRTEALRGPETQRREDRDFAGARDSETGGQRLCGGQRREDRDFAGARDSETGGQMFCGGQRLRDRRTETLRGPKTQRREDRGFAGARDGRTEALRGPETQRREDRGFAGARDRRTETLRGPETQRREDRDFAGARGSETGGQRLCGGQRLRERQRKVHFGDVVLGEPLRPSSCLRPPDYDERSHLHDAFTQMTHSLQEVAAAQGSFRVAFPHAAEKMQKVISQLKEVQACIRPCGLQEVARRFRCRGCYSTVCDLPLDCPVQDLTVTRGHQAMFFCTVNFQLPKEEITYSWKFAGGGLRTQDLSYFREIPRARGYLARIRPVQPTHRGTFSCVITHDQRPLARLYFFLNGCSFDGTAAATNKALPLLT